MAREVAVATMRQHQDRRAAVGRVVRKVMDRVIMVRVSQEIKQEIRQEMVTGLSAKGMVRVAILLQVVQPSPGMAGRLEMVRDPIRLVKVPPEPMAIRPM